MNSNSETPTQHNINLSLLNSVNSGCNTITEGEIVNRSHKDSVRWNHLERNELQFMEDFLRDNNKLKSFRDGSNLPINYSSKISEYNKKSAANLKYGFSILKMFNSTHNHSYYFFIEETPDKKSIVKSIEEENVRRIIESLMVLKTSSYAICKFNINKDYIIESFLDNEFSLLCFGTHKRNTRSKKKKQSAKTKIASYDLLGFIFCKQRKGPGIKSDKEAYLSLICSNKGFGGIMLQFMENFLENMGYSRLYLSAIESAMPYYLFKCGYNFVPGKNRFLLKQSSGTLINGSYVFEKKREIGKVENGKIKLKTGKTTNEYGNNLSARSRNNRLSSNNLSQRRRSKRLKVISSRKKKKDYRFELRGISLTSDDKPDINMFKILDAFVR